MGSGSARAALFQLHDWVDCMDREGVWRAGQVVDARPGTAGRAVLKVHFEGFSVQHDEWVEATSPKLAELGSRSIEQQQQQQQRSTQSKTAATSGSTYF